uniref:pyridoxamine 5'-phosphate oxidase family protein n=1 Tax=Methylobacterium fujisawaense TaxID=107400 RepID=UPI00313C590D
MGSFYTPEHRALQDRFVTRRLADTQERAIVSERLSEADRTFIAERDMLFLSTTDATGQPTVSYKGGAPGFEADDPDPRDRFADGGDPSLKATTSLCDTLRTFALNLR